MKTNYRGFDIVLNNGGQWSAEISNPTTGKPWSQRLTAEGQAQCLKRARNLVDAFLALHGPGQA